MARQPVLIWSSVLVVLQILAGGAALGDVIGLQAAGLFILAVASLQGGTQFYIRGAVTPNGDVVASRQDGTAGPVAGAASPLPDGTPVEVVDAELV